MKSIRLIICICLMLSFANCQPIHQSEPITIYTIGDSTMANKPDPDINPERGWAQMLHQFFSDQITIDNRAVNGRSTRSFRALSHWNSVHDNLQKGDYVFIQFGHNDGKITDPTRFTNPHISFRHNLINYVNETREKGAIPVLFTSIARRNFNKEGVLLDTHGDYTLVTRLVAENLGVTLIDLQYYTERLEESYGVNDSKKLHLHFAPGENNYIPDGIQDNTHLSVLGANKIASLVIEELKNTNHALAKYIKQ